MPQYSFDRTYGEPHDRDSHEGKTPKGHGTCLCPQCGALRLEKRWFYRDQVTDREQAMLANAGSELCPGCRSVQGNAVAGTVKITGPWTDEQKTQMRNRIRNLVAREEARNPRARLLSLDDDGETITVNTTHQWLAVQIGKELHKALSGADLHIQWPPGDEMARVFLRHAEEVGTRRKPHRNRGAA